MCVFYVNLVSAATSSLPDRLVSKDIGLTGSYVSSMAITFVAASVQAMLDPPGLRYVMLSAAARGSARKMTRGDASYRVGDREPLVDASSL